MSGIEQAANDLFFKLRNRFPNINMGDENGTTTSNPTDARFFNFDYEQDDVKFGNITASLIDNQNLKIYFSKDVTTYMDRDEKRNWYKFLQEIRKFSKAHMLGLDVRDIAKDALSQKDLKFVSTQNKDKTQIGESRVLWARRGTVSEGDVGNVKVHVVHSERMDENPNNRLLRVDRIFLVNESGERFLLPFKSVVGAKAMANHVSRGGNPYDSTGSLISTAISEMTNLRRFASATRRKTFESEEANQVIEAASAIKESIKRSLFRLANNTRFDENLEDLGKLIAEQDDVVDIKPMFMQNVYNENLDNWIGSAAKAFKQYKGNIMENLKESAGTVAAKLKDPSFKLVLKDDPSEDRLIASSKYSDGRALLRRILGTIADRIGMDDSEIANWASQIGQDMEEGKASPEDMQIALQLAKRYQEDLKKIASNADYGKEVRVAAFGQKKDLYGKVKGGAEEEFESFVNGIGEGEENVMMDEINADEHGMDMAVEGEGAEETSMDRVRARVAARSNKMSEGGDDRNDEPLLKSNVEDEDKGLPNKSDWEYDKEGDMAKDEIHTIVRHAEELEHALGDDENLPEWVQEKLGQIKGMMTSVSDYMLTQHERGDEKRSGEEGIHGDDMGEGNEFSGALAKAKASHQDKFDVDGKTYPVKESNDSLALMRKLAGLR